MQLQLNINGQFTFVFYIFNHKPQGDLTTKFHCEENFVPGFVLQLIVLLNKNFIVYDFEWKAKHGIYLYNTLYALTVREDLMFFFFVNYKFELNE